MSHIKKVAKNTAYGYLHILTIKIVQFALRTVFIYTLGVVYLGVNGLFSNILGLLSFAELGIGGIINTSLYKPISLDDKEKVKAYINVYKKVYHIIAMIVAILGIALLPFLDFFVNYDGDIGNIKVYYLIYLFNVVISYFATYYYSIPRSYEQGYIVSKIYSFFTILIGIIQTIVLLLTRNFYLFLLSQTVMIIVEKFYIYLKIKKLYPWVFYNTKQCKLNQSEYLELFKNSKAMIFLKLLQTSISSTDNIIISHFLGISLVGYVSNYVLVSNTFYSIVSQIFDNVTPSIGNIINTNDNHFNNKILDIILFLAYLIYGYVSIGFILLISTFIYLWLGESFVLGTNIAIVFGLIILTMGLKTAYFSFKDAFAIFYDDYMFNLYASLINIFFSLLLVKYFRLVGVFIGTLITELFLLFIKTLVSYKRITNCNISNLLIKLFKFYLNFGICLFISWFIISKLIVSINIGTFLISIIVLTIVFLIYNSIVYYNTDEFRYLKKISITFILHLKSRLKGN